MNTREKNSISAKDILGKYEWKQQKSQMDEEFSKTVGQRKQAKLLCLQDTDQIIADNLKNARCETSRHFSKKKRECLKGKINECETNSKNRNIRHSNRGRNEFKTGYQPKAKWAKDDKCFLPADSHSILNTRKYNVCQFLNIHVPNDIRYTEIHTAEPLAPGPSALVPERLRWLLRS